MPRKLGQFDYDQIKERHNVAASATAWKGLAELAEELGYRSRSDLIEAIGRRKLRLEIMNDENQAENK